MPRRARRPLGGYVLHVLNRGARRGELFCSPSDYERFEAVLAEALDRWPVELYDYCVMPNHFHLVLRPPVDSDLRKFMHWLTTTHALRWRRANDTLGEGTVYQGRYKAIPVQTGEHFLTLCRYVALNPVRASLTQQAEEWKWSSAWRRVNPGSDLRLQPWPVPRPMNWLALVNTALPEEDLTRCRESVNRGFPLGNSSWQQETAKMLGIEHTLRRPGPKKVTPVADCRN